MKTKKELLQVFLQGIGIWDSFFHDLKAQFWLPIWETVNDDLKNLLRLVKFLEENKNNPMLKKTSEMLIVNQLENAEFMEQLVLEDVISAEQFQQALSELCKYAEVPPCDINWQKISFRSSIMDIIDKVYALQPIV